MNFLWAAVTVTVLLAVATTWRIVREPRRPLNGLLMVATAVSLWVTLLARGFQRDPDGGLATLMFYGSLATVMLAIGVTGLALIGNSVVVVGREGAHLSTFVPAAFGIALLGVAVAPVIGLVLLSSDTHQHPLIGEILVFLVTPLCAVPILMVFTELVAFTVYAVLYSRITRPRHADAVVILGAGLNGTQPTPLLAARIDRGIDIWHRLQDAGEPVPLVLSGGRGADEEVSEAEAMASYARRAGVPDGSMILEDRSTTTRENLEFSRELLDAGARMVVVTSNYHALRTAGITEELGIPAQVVGSRTASYFVPAGFLREFVAVVNIYRRKNLRVWAVVSAVWLIAFVALLIVSTLNHEVVDAEALRLR